MCIDEESLFKLGIPQQSTPRLLQVLASGIKLTAMGLFQLESRFIALLNVGKHHVAQWSGEVIRARSARCLVTRKPLHFGGSQERFAIQSFGFGFTDDGP